MAQQSNSLDTPLNSTPDPGQALLRASRFGPDRGIGDECRHVFVQFLALLLVDVHHMPGLVIFHADIFMQALVEPEMLEGVFRRKVRCAKVIISIRHEDS